MSWRTTIMDKSLGTNLHFCACTCQTRIQHHLPIKHLPHSPYNVERYYQQFLLIFNWTLYTVRRGNSNAFLRESSAFFQNSLVKHVQTNKLHKCPKEFVHDYSYLSSSQLLIGISLNVAAKLTDLFCTWLQSNHACTCMCQALCRCHRFHMGLNTKLKLTYYQAKQKKFQD